MEGDFDGRDLELVLLQVSRLRQNGALCLENAERATAVFYFSAGHLCYAEFDGKPLPLLDMLVALGKLAPGDARTARAHCGLESDRGLVSWLLQQRLVTVDDILPAARARLLESVQRVHAWTRGTFRFERDRQPPEDALAYRLGAAPIEEGKTAPAPQQLASCRPPLPWDEGQPSIDEIFALAALQDVDPRTFDLDPQQWKIIVQVSRGKSVRQMARHLQMDVPALQQKLRELLSMGLVQVAPPVASIPSVSLPPTAIGTASAADASIAVAAPSESKRPIIAHPVPARRGLAKRLLTSPELRGVGRRLSTGSLTLLICAYLAIFGLIMAERGQKGLAAEPVTAAISGLERTWSYITAHPPTYLWRRENTAAFVVVATAVVNSAGLLLTALGAAALLGIPIGIALASWRRLRGLTVVLLFSVLAISTPSFLLAMLLWVLNAQFYRVSEIPGLPSTGFGWDAHLVMPALVLAARPFAQVIQVTHISLKSVFDDDYVRTARGKGLREQAILIRHALRNALIPILTTLSTSLRFSLSSLPVVESFFVWPGVGYLLLQAIEARNAPLVTDLVLSLGALFLLINLILETVYALIDPRLRLAAEAERREEQGLPWPARLLSVWEWLKESVRSFRRAREPRVPLPRLSASTNSPATVVTPTGSRRRLLKSTLGNPALIVGTFLITVFVGLALLGDQLPLPNPYTTRGLTKVDGELAVPPFKPSQSFPWGSDPVGRDLQTLVIMGTKQTLALALFGMFARVLVGTTLGMLAAWSRGSRLDRFVLGAVGVWAAFPATLFAMILILALGIQQGMWVFVIALAVVGWGEIAQAVRSQVITIKHQLFIEGARAVGARTHAILVRHILPNLLPSLIVLGVLELGGVLMLLAELGFLNIFIGGGFRTAVGETGNMSPRIYYYSDVPEWGALLANIRTWWLSSPWLAWYPGLFFFAAILGFHLWGEGLRRFFEESRVNVSRLFNRFTLGLGAALVVALVWVLQTNAPLSMYTPQARQFDAQRAMQDIRVLSSPEYEGREAGTPGGRRAAEYIAARMKEIGLNPGNDNGTFLLSNACPIFHLTSVPQLEMTNSQNGAVIKFIYRQDMVEYISVAASYGQALAPVVGLALGPDPAGAFESKETAALLGGTNQDPYGLARMNLRNKIVVVRDEKMRNVNPNTAAAVLVVTDNLGRLESRYLYHKELARFTSSRSSPSMYITAQAAERILGTAGSSLADLDRLQADLAPGEATVTTEGAKVQIKIDGKTDLERETCDNVVGYVPGTGAVDKLDNQVIVVSAYYGGLGQGPDGTLYPGANDNASGVAAMLEMARVMKQTNTYPSKKTLVFVAWPQGERWENFSIWEVMNATRGLNQLSVETIIELSGVGTGDGRAIALGPGTSFRLTQLFQGAADQMGNSLTLRGRSPHFDQPAAAGFGGRQALSAYVSWDGSDRDAHTVRDSMQAIDPDKLTRTGQTVLLALSVLGRHVDY